MSELFYDVAIIGGGISGLYIGTRLAHSEPNKRIGLFEASDRLGGRVHSIQDTNLGSPCELGCMRYLKSQHITTQLIERDYSLEIQPFDTGKIQQHIYYLRGQRVNATTWENLPYNLPASLQNKSPVQILDGIIDEIKQQNKVPLTGVLPEDLVKIKMQMNYPYPGRLYKKNLQDIGFANLITESSSYETLKFISDSGEYFAKTINWNSAEAFPYSQSVGYKAKDDIEYWCVKDGFSSLIQELNRSFLASGGQIHTDTQLFSIEKIKHDHGKYRLTFRSNDGSAIQQVVCNTLILALPKQALQQLVWYSSLGELFYSSYFKKLLNSVRILPTIRFALLFKNAWWQSDFNGLNGHMVTDLPIRHGYYFGSLDPKRYSVFLSTVDMHVTDFWEPYLNRDQEYGFLEKSAVAELLKQLQLIHRCKQDIELPVKATYSNWSSSLYGGGFHAWNPGYSVEETMKLMRKPFAQENIHIIGEAFSNLQGWIEGALYTAEQLLKEHFSEAFTETLV